MSYVLELTPEAGRKIGSARGAQRRQTRRNCGRTLDRRGARSRVFRDGRSARDGRETLRRPRAGLRGFGRGAEVRFYTLEAVLALHQLNIERFGGSPGIRDQGALESALNAPIDRAYYEEADAVKCAAAYGFNLCQAHAFADGNKRIAAVTCEGFLRGLGRALGARTGHDTRAQRESQQRLEFHVRIGVHIKWRG